MANRVTQEVLEIVSQPITQQARVTQVVLELVLSSSAVLGPSNGNNSLLWLPSLEQESTMHAGVRNLLIQLNTGQTIPNDGNWKESRAISSKVACSYPNFISYGGYFKWDYDTPFPPGVQVIQRVGLLFYDANFTVIYEALKDFGIGTAQGTSGLWVKAANISAVPVNAAYVALECAAFIVVASSVSSPFTTTTHKYADLRWDDLWMIQQTDPTNAMQPVGSLPPTWTSPFTYTSASTSITWRWAATGIFRADGTTQPIATGSVTINGLTASTDYYFFPYWDENLQVVAWVVSTHGTPPNNFAFLSSELDLTQSQQQNLFSRVALSTTAMVAGTTGAAHGGGGGGGGSGRCNRIGTKVLTRLRGTQNLEDCEIGEEIRGRKGWTIIKSKQIMPSLFFIRVELEGGDAIEVTPTHPFTVPSGDGDVCKRALELSLQDALYTTSGMAFPSVIRSVRVESTAERAACVSVSCEPEHEFYAGEEKPNILSHNVTYVT